MPAIAGQAVPQDRVTLVAGSEVIAPGIRALAAPGQSAGQLSISMTSEDEALVCIGDVARAPGHLAHLAWYARYDRRPAMEDE